MRPFQRILHFILFVLCENFMELKENKVKLRWKCIKIENNKITKKNIEKISSTPPSEMQKSYSI